MMATIITQKIMTIFVNKIQNNHIYYVYHSNRNKTHDIITISKSNARKSKAKLTTEWCCSAAVWSTLRIRIIPNKAHEKYFSS